LREDSVIQSQLTIRRAIIISTLVSRSTETAQDLWTQRRYLIVGVLSDRQKTVFAGD